LQNVEWGEFRYKSIFNKIVQGRRLKKDDQISGEIPFVMAGTTNAGVVNYISNPVASFPKNSITVDIFGNVFYRDYDFGAGDDTGVYWNNEKEYSKETMLFFAVSMEKSLLGKFSFGKKLRSSQSFDFKIQLPIQNGKIDFEFMESFIVEMEAERIAKLEAERIAKLEAYLLATGLKDYTLTAEEKQVLDDFEQMKFEEFNVIDIFNVKNTGNILSRDIVENSGVTPYLCASAENNAVSSYISYDEKYLDKGNCVFIGGKTFVVTYQEKDFYSNDSHNLVLYLKNEENRNKSNQLYLATCINKSLKHKYSWGDSISNTKIKKDKVSLPTQNNQPNFTIMETFISAIQKLVIKEVVLYADRKIAATKTVVNK
jgi:hypothetical protein